MIKTTKKRPSPYGPIRFTSIDEYHKSFPPKTRKMLDTMRRTIKSLIPEAEETISYNIPTFKQTRNLVHYAGYKEHIGFYPTPGPLKEFKQDLVKYKTTKGAVQFPLDQPLPIALIKKMVKFRVKAESEKGSAKKSKARDFTHYHKDGTVWAKGKMSGDLMDDYWEWFRKDGMIMRSGYFNKGKQVGEWITYDKKGKVHKVTRMKEGK